MWYNSMDISQTRYSWTIGVAVIETVQNWATLQQVETDSLVVNILVY